MSLKIIFGHNEINNKILNKSHFIIQQILLFLLFNISRLQLKLKIHLKSHNSIKNGKLSNSYTAINHFNL